MDFDMFGKGGARTNSERAKTSNAIMQVACPHDLKARAADPKWRPRTVETTQVDDRKIVSPDQDTP